MKTDKDFSSWLEVTVQSASNFKEETKMDTDKIDSTMVAYAAGFRVGQKKSGGWYAVGFALGVAAVAITAFCKK